MLTIEQIAQDVGELQMRNWKKQFKRRYDKMDSSDLSEKAYVDSRIRHAYASIQQERATNSRQGAD